jgi:hypothetical protein
MGCVTSYQVVIRDPSAPAGAPLTLRRLRLAEVPGAGGARAACEDAAPGAPAELSVGANGVFGVAGGVGGRAALLPPAGPQPAAVIVRWAPPKGAQCVTAYKVELLDACSSDANSSGNSSSGGLRPLEGCAAVEVPAAAPPLLQARFPCAAAARRVAARVTGLNGAKAGGTAASGALRLAREGDALAGCLDVGTPTAPRLEGLSLRTATAGGGGQVGPASKCRGWGVPVPWHLRGSTSLLFRALSWCPHTT